MNESPELLGMRAMAWERAKGELHSMSHTYYSITYSEDAVKYNNFMEAFNKFVHTVEDKGLHE
jgi:hypothetical protein